MLDLGIDVPTHATPPLKWAGGKRWLVPYLEPMWLANRHRRLVEPFCGGLAVTLGFVPCQALLNDINPHLVNFYRWLKRGLVTTLPMQNDEDQFYVCRERFNQLVREGLVDSQEAAELFYYLNRTCFNGLCRFNRRGEFNVPFGRYKQIAYKSDFTIYKDVFAGWSFTVGDFQQVPLNSDDFIYADPPYDVEFTQYSKEAFGWHEQVRLALWLARHEGPVVLSNQATPRIVDLYQQLDFDLRFFDAPRRISNTGDRTPAKEVVATRNVQAHSNAILG